MDTILDLNCLVKEIKGVGPKKVKALENLNVRTVEDLLFLFPRRYEDRRNIKTIQNLINGEKASVKAKVIMIVKSNFRYGKKKTLRLLVEDETGTMEVVFFNANYLERTVKKDSVYMLFGNVSVKDGKTQMIHPDINIWEKGDHGEILPIYPLSKGLSQKDLRKWQTSLNKLKSDLKDYLPELCLNRNKLCDINYALNNIHFPKEPQKLKAARFRLIFEEFLMLQVGLLTLRARNEQEKCGIKFGKNENLDEFLVSFPFKFTKGQLRVLNDIICDMESINIMHRLVQGDVGSGKTAIAQCAMYKAVKNGFQAVIMAPTEILARQHYEGFKKQFRAFNIEVGFLSGSLSAKEKREALEKIENGDLQIVVGTHALIQPNVKFKNLGLVITDEQHRFGVEQRAKLSEKGTKPDILVMTATPIPRTLAVILYGDLDISYINEMPPGRQKIITSSMSHNKRSDAYEFMATEVSKGRQAYIVAPLIEDSENIDAKSTNTLFEEITDQFKHYNVGMIHGALKQSEKDSLMERFYSGEIQILVSTVVIEVGINVPNATVMIIENAERFGLAQLHQLRGRVGRGKEQSYCMLITDENMEIAQERAKTMTETGDGFIIAEKDLELRGPGEFFGIRQHGLPELRLADFAKHRDILFKARDEAKMLLENDPYLTETDNLLFKERLERMFSIERTNL